MNVPPSANQLVELVHQYFPTRLRGDEPGHDSTVESRRLEAARQRARVEGQERWTRFLTKLREALPESTVEDWTVLWSNDNCWRVRVNLPAASLSGSDATEHRAVVGLVSILAPVAATYTSVRRKVGERWLQPSLFYEPMLETRGAEEALDKFLHEAMGVTRLPNETLFTPVVDIQCGNVHLGEARLIDCLFTDDRW